MLDKWLQGCYNIVVADEKATKIKDGNENGSLAQLGEHLPYKQRVIGSSPITPTIFGSVVQLVRTPACHAGGRGFEPHPSRHFRLCSSVGRARD